METVPKKKPIKWLKNHENLLLKLWAQNIIELKTTDKKVKNSHIFQNIANQLKDAGFNEVRGKDVKTKLDNMKRKYRAILRHWRAAGKKPFWQHFQKVNNILQEARLISESDVVSNDNIIMVKHEPIVDDEILPMSPNASVATESSFDATDCSQEPPAKKRRSINTDDDDDLTAFERAMLSIERDRTDQMAFMAQRRLEIMNSMAAENADFHVKLLALIKSNSCSCNKK